MYGYEVTEHEIMSNYLVKFNDKDGKPMMIVPIDVFAAEIFSKNFDISNTPLAPAHRMLTDVIDMLGGSIRKIVINNLTNGRLFAKVYLIDGYGENHIIKAEASDAITMAILKQCPLYVMESIIEKTKNDRKNRIYWYDPEDEAVLDAVRSGTHNELVALPLYEIKQLLEIAAKIEDFEFAARLKKVFDEQNSNVEKFKSIIKEALAENPEKFYAELKEIMEEEINKLNQDNDDVDNDNDDKGNER
jgi:bifunctional DNase/RNase